MISLKAFLPHLSLYCGLSPVALYERQRQLVRLGLLPKPNAPGRKSGSALADEASVAMMIIAVLATDNLSEVDERIANWANLEARSPRDYSKTAPCRFTKKATFHQALTAVLADEMLSSDLRLEVNRDKQIAVIHWWSKPERSTRFGYGRSVTGPERVVRYRELFNLHCEIDIAKTDGKGSNPITVYDETLRPINFSGRRSGWAGNEHITLVKLNDLAIAG